MTRSQCVRFRSWATVAALVVGPCQSAWQPTQPLAEPEQASAPRNTEGRTASIRGQVTAAESSRPLRRARVRAFGLVHKQSRTTFTDAAGEYDLKDLLADRYVILASKGGYIPLQYGQRRPLEFGRPLEVAEGQKWDRVSFVLPRGAVVTGQVTDEFGDPVTDATVVPLIYTYQRGRRKLSQIGRSAQTNDIGEYRLFGLLPGTYYISATIRSVAGETDDRSGYAATYYPSTSSATNATTIQLNVAQTLRDIDIALEFVKTAQLSGKVIDSSDRPITQGFVTFTKKAGVVVEGATQAELGADGGFVATALPPGSYTLFVDKRDATGAPIEAAAVDVAVVGNDVPDMLIKTVALPVLKGKVVLDTDKPEHFNSREIKISAIPVDFNEGPFEQGVPIVLDSGWNADVRLLPGTSLLRLVDNPTTLVLDAVRIGGRDVTDVGIRSGPERITENVDIVLSETTTQVSGTATTVAGEAANDYSVILYPRDQDLRGYLSRYVWSGRSDQNGQFLVRGLPPGQYFAIASDQIAPANSLDPAYLAMLTDATAFELTRRESKRLVLTLRATK